MPNGTRKPRPPRPLTQRGAGRRLAQERAAGQTTVAAADLGLGVPSPRRAGPFVGAPLPPGGVPTTGPVGAIDPFAAALQQRPAQFREKALARRPRRVGMTRVQTQAQGHIGFF